MTECNLPRVGVSISSNGGYSGGDYSGGATGGGATSSCGSSSCGGGGGETRCLVFTVDIADTLQPEQEVVDVAAVAKRRSINDS